MKRIDRVRHAQEQRVDRRSFLTAVGVASVCAASPIPSWAVGTADIFQLGALALDSTRTFSEAEDRLSAIIGANQKLLQLALEKLADVQMSLMRLELGVQALPEETRRIVDQLYLKQVIDPILGVKTRYAESLATIAANPRAAASATVRREFEDLLKAIREGRSQLMNMREGCGASAVFIIPIACALESALSYRTADGKPVLLIQSLRSYETWLGKVLGPSETAVNGELLHYAQAHDALVDEFAATSRYRALDKLKIAAHTHADFEVPDGCIMFINSGSWPPSVTDNPAADLSGGTINGGASLVAKVKIHFDGELPFWRPMVEDAVPDIALVNRNTVITVQDGHVTFPYTGTLPQAMPCTIYTQHEFTRPENLIAHVATMDQHKNIMADRSKLRTLVAKLAVYRALMAHCAQARVAANATLAQVTRARRRLELL